MNLEPLMELGLTLNESKVYYQLSKIGEITAGDLTKKVDLHRSRVYEVLDRLIRKGLVYFNVINKIKYFRAKDPSVLFDLLDEKREKIEDFIPKIRKVQENHLSKQDVEVYSGIGGIKSILNEVLKVEEYFSFGAPQNSIRIMGNVFWENYNLKLNKKSIKTKMIFNDELRSWSNVIKFINPKAKIKFLLKHFDNLTQTFILNDKIIMIVWSDYPTGIIINDKEVSKAYKHFFKQLWKMASN